QPPRAAASRRARTRGPRPRGVPRGTPRRGGRATRASLRARGRSRARGQVRAARRGARPAHPRAPLTRRATRRRAPLIVRDPEQLSGSRRSRIFLPAPPNIPGTQNGSPFVLPLAVRVDSRRSEHAEIYLRQHGGGGGPRRGRAEPHAGDRPGPEI